MCKPMSTTASFTVAKMWRQPKCCSMGEQMGKMYTHTHTDSHTHTDIHPMGNHSPIKKEENLAIHNSIGNAEGIMLTEISQIKKDKYCIVSLIYGIRMEKKIKNGSWQEFGSWGNRVLSVKEYKLSGFIKVSSKALTFSIMTTVSPACLKFTENRT